MSGPRDAVAREYRGLAARYDDRWGRYIRATVRQTIRRLPAEPGPRLLDVGCGTGALLEAAAGSFSAARLVGMDMSPDMLAVARGKLPVAVGLIAGAADALPFPDGRFDTVVSTNAFHFFRSPRRALSEIARVLRPGGTVVITDWCDDFLACRICDRLLRLFSAAHHRTYDAAECRALLEGAGFEIARLDRYKIDWFWGLMTAVARKAG